MAGRQVCHVQRDDDGRPFSFHYLCPACVEGIPRLRAYHRVHLPLVAEGQEKVGKVGWTWDGNLERPTIKPSVLLKVQRPWMDDKFICHSHVRDGKIEFLDDCTHVLAGRTVDLPEWTTEDRQ